MQLLTTKIAKTAIDIVTPTIQHMMDGGLVKRPHLYIVVPVLRSAEEFKILAVGMFGDKKDWAHPYDLIAKSKAEISWRTGHSSSYIHHCAPHLLHSEDTRFWGSDVLDEMVAACSGVQPYFDEMFAAMVNRAMLALCKEKLAGINGGAEKYEQATGHPVDFLAVPHRKTA